MNAIIQDTMIWWRGGDLLMSAMFFTSMILYTMLAARTIFIWRSEKHHHADHMPPSEATKTINTDTLRARTHTAQYATMTMSEAIAGEIAVTRAITACLPLLGLLGTVTGMVDTFGSLGLTDHQRSTTTNQASAGISLALTATQYGMALAIPAIGWDWLISRQTSAPDHKGASAGDTDRANGTSSENWDTK